MHHVNCRANFLVDSIKFSQNDAVNSPRISLIDCEVDECLIELSQLIDSVISYQGFSNKEHNVWRVDMDELGQLSHQPFVALHAPGRVNKHHVEVLALSI